MTSFQLINGDCLEVLKTLPDNSVDSIVTDPPYGISFMGKKWDYDVPTEEVWKECLRVLKPGGHLLSFAGTRTQHRMAVRIEDAGFEIRDMIAWIYGSGFPKSLNIGKAVDKLQGDEREVVGKTQSVQFQEKGYEYNGKAKGSGFANEKYWGFGNDVTKGHSEWEGWGTALKPALEPITVARKPIEGTVAENCLKWGVGGINIDESRVGLNGEENPSINRRTSRPPINNVWNDARSPESYAQERPSESLGRWPANLIHDGSEEVLECFPDTGKSTGGRANQTTSKIYGEYANNFEKRDPGFGDSGSAARFFYCAKASKKDRDEGLEGEAKQYSHDGREKPIENAYQRNNSVAKNNHPTVKPTALMRYLVKLVTPPGGTVLDPFTGSGSTGKACKLEGFDFIGIEREEEYVKIAEARIKAVPDTLL